MMKSIAFYLYLCEALLTNIMCVMKIWRKDIFKSAEEVGHNHMHYFIIWRLPYISVCASRRIIVIDSGMIVLITERTLRSAFVHSTVRVRHSLSLLLL